MNKFFLLSVLITLLSLNCFELYSSDLKLIEVQDWENCSIFDIESVDSNNCIALSEPKDNAGAQLFKSTDQGRSWNMFYRSRGISDSLFLNTMLFEYPDTNHIYILFHSKQGIKKSDDGGKTFKNNIINNGEFTYRNSFCMIDSNRGFYYDLGTFHVTEDGWETNGTRVIKQLGLKTPVPIDTANIQMFRFSDSTNSNGNDIAHDDLVNYNFEENKWTTLYNFTKYPGDNDFDVLLALTYPTDSIGYAVGEQYYNGGDQRSYNIIYKTTDQGRTWKRIHKRLHSFGLMFVSFYDENNGVVVGHGDNLAMTNDGGDTWYYPEFANFDPLNSRVHWLGKTFIIGDFSGNFWRYEGDFFKFKNNSIITPFLIYPDDDSLIESESVKFKWKHSSDTLNFIFQLSHRSDMNDLVFEKYTDKNVSSIEYDDLILDKQYFWRVAATNGKDTTWSKIFSFSTGFAPPITIFPDCGDKIEDNNTELKWTDITDADAYELEIAYDENFDYNFLYLDYVEENTLELNGLPTDTIYYWKVKAFNDTESTNWSDICSFIVGKPNSVFELLLSDIKITPNPAEEYIEISVNNPSEGLKPSEGSEIEIYDVLGNVVINYELKITNYDIPHKIDVSHLPKGVYFVKIGNRVEKFVKM